MKTKIKQFTNGWAKTLVYYSFLIIVIELIGLTSLALVAHAVLNCNNPYLLAEVIVPDKVEAKELSPKEYILQETAKAGLKAKDIECLMKYESGYKNTWHYNNDKTLDRGIWMLNSYWHEEISNECAFSLECSTKEAIRIIKQDKNYHQWHGFTNNCK
jgi:hypothetical protein